MSRAGARRNVVLVIILGLLASLPACSALADPPELQSWLRNTSGQMGYNGLPADVQRVRYSASNVYVNCSDIPDYSIGPWPGNPNTPTNQNYLFRIPRAPVTNTGTRTATPLGRIAVWVNGVVAFNAKDARSYNDQNIWHQNAVAVEGPSFDACLGHPAPGGVYHHHQNPRCLYTASPSEHSPLLGYAYDGFPVYGPYGYANADGSGGIARIRSGYQLRNITQRHTLPDGTVLSPAQYGPDVSTTYPLGYYIEDYEFAYDLGDLDECNGRFAVTPEYPVGTYAYWVTIDGGGASAYPYAIGPTYFGVVAADDISTGGHVTIGESVVDYMGPAGVEPGASGLALAQSAPNPFAETAVIGYRIAERALVSLRVFDLRGREVRRLLDAEQPAGVYTVPVARDALPPGVYYYQLRAGGQVRTRRMLVVP